MPASASIPALSTKQAHAFAHPDPHAHVRKTAGAEETHELPRGFTWNRNSRRSPVMGRKAMVACTQPLAATAGYDILKRGGNAADAAVAVASCLTVCEPSSTGIGGDLFCLFWDAKTGKVRALNASGRSAKALSLDVARKRGWVTKDPEASIPDGDLNAVTVPGAAAGWCDAVKHFGSGKLSMADILAPATDLAENGFPVEPVAADLWNTCKSRLTAHSTTYSAPSEWLIPTTTASGTPDLRAPYPSEVFAIPTLAATFRTVAEQGKDGFYRGPIAKAIVETVRKAGGLLTEEDLASHESTLTEPISAEYEGVRVWEHAPNGQGLAALLALRILHHLQHSNSIAPLSTTPHNSPAYLHALVWALRLAFADVRRHVCDPTFRAVPVEQLLSDEYVAERCKLYDPERAPSAGDVEGGFGTEGMAGFGKGADTVYLSVVDEEGNACSLINSTYMPFGSGAVVPGTGIILQNRGANFSLQEGHPNVLEGGKRPYHTIIPAMATWSSTNTLWLSFGVMGGFNQPQGHVQVLLNMLRGMDPQAALDMPRVCIDVNKPPEFVVNVDEGVDEGAVEELRRRGHNVVVRHGWERATMGRGQIIETHHDARTGKRVLIGGSDLRGDGMAVGY